jgi:predicted nucleotidyltransferase/uncharacterized protein with HEPN domain
MSASIDEYRAKLKAMLPELAEKFGVAELGLFGSRVRGDNRQDSDLDVLVTYREDARPSLFDLVELEDSLSQSLGLKVDLIDRKSLRSRLRPYILAGDGAKRIYSHHFDTVIHSAQQAITCAAQLSLAEIQADELRSAAIAGVVCSMGRVCERIPDSIRNRFANIPWKHLTHLIGEYDALDWDGILTAIRVYVPAALPHLIDARKILLAEEPPPPEIPE